MRHLLIIIKVEILFILTEVKLLTAKCFSPTGVKRRQYATNLFTMELLLALCGFQIINSFMGPLKERSVDDDYDNDGIDDDDDDDNYDSVFLQ